ncbi:MAG TPA: VWA domain-containing protein [Bacteroidota bacterium]|jgi:Ca-activated chloride channel family protein|nr:VWA domain-containing protein [Bacteroidota bacterium]
MWINSFTFANPEFLYGLLIIPILIFWYLKKDTKLKSDLLYPNILVFKSIKSSFKQKLRHVLFVLRIIAIFFLIIVLARPQTSAKGENVFSEGIDIVLCLDVSGSMLAADFNPNRLEAAKKVASEFIDGRTNDRIGLVIFSAESFTQCPMTLDYTVLKNLLMEVRSGLLEDGTAIGMGIATSVNRLKDSKAKSKVIILLTDGVNNRGSIDPITATQLAQSYNIRIYTIGVGTIGEAPFPIQTPYGIRYQNMPVEIDENMLKQIAQMTGGEYYRATNNKKLKEIYDKIDKLEKTRIEVKEFRRYTELFYSFLFVALLALFVEIILRNTIFRKIP